MKTFLDPLTAAEHDAYLAGFQHGYGDALDRGRELAEQEMAERWAELAAAVRRVADQPPWAELQRRRRGEAA